jgi:hypothetical protein
MIFSILFFYTPVSTNSFKKIIRRDGRNDVCKSMLLCVGELNRHPWQKFTPRVYMRVSRCMRLKYVPACPPSLTSLETSSRNIRIRISGSETLSQVCVALTTTGESLPHHSPHLTSPVPADPSLRYSFPGSQPVSFTTKDLQRLENEECVFLSHSSFSSLMGLL